MLRITCQRSFGTRVNSITAATATATSRDIQTAQLTESRSSSTRLVTDWDWHGVICRLRRPLGIAVSMHEHGFNALEKAYFDTSAMHMYRHIWKVSSPTDRSDFGRLRKIVTDLHGNRAPHKICPSYTRVLAERRRWWRTILSARRVSPLDTALLR